MNPPIELTVSLVFLEYRQLYLHSVELSESLPATHKLDLNLSREMSRKVFGETQSSGKSSFAIFLTLVDMIS